MDAANFHYALDALKAKCIRFWQSMTPSPALSCELKNLLEMHGMRGEWEKVVNLSSRAVLHLDKTAERAPFYYIWICALHELFDYDALRILGLHLIKMRKQSDTYVALASLCFHFSGKRFCERATANYLRSLKKRSFIAREALGLFFAFSAKKREKIFGLKTLKANVTLSKGSYFSWRNYIRALSENNCENEMAAAYNGMTSLFPFAPEPYLTSALIAMDERQWGEATRLLSQLKQDNPEDSSCYLALAECLMEQGQLDEAFSLLEENRIVFSSSDHEFYLLTGKIIRLKAIAEKLSTDDMLVDEAIYRQQKALSIAHKIGVTYRAIEEEIAELRLLVAEEEAERILLPLSGEFSDLSILEENLASNLSILEAQKLKAS